MPYICGRLSAVGAAVGMGCRETSGRDKWGLPWPEGCRWSWTELWPQEIPGAHHVWATGSTRCKLCRGRLSKMLELFLGHAWASCSRCVLQGLVSGPGTHGDNLGQLVRAPGFCSCLSSQGGGEVHQMALFGAFDKAEFPSSPPVWQMLFG